MKLPYIIFLSFLLLFSFVGCFGKESLVYQVERIQPVKDRPVSSTDRVEGEDCVGLIFPFLLGRFSPDLQEAYNSALEKAPLGTQSLANGEVYTRGFILPPLILFRCIVVSGTPSME